MISGWRAAYNVRVGKPLVNLLWKKRREMVTEYGQFARKEPPSCRGGKEMSSIITIDLLNPEG